MSTISASTTSTTAYKVTADTTGTLVLQTGATPTTAVTIDGSQNVNVGSVQDGHLTVSGATGINGAGFSVYETSTGTGKRLRITQETSAVVYNATYTSGGNYHIWQNANSEVMRLDSSGNLLVGTTTAGFSSQSGISVNGPTAATYIAVSHANGTSTGAAYMGFPYNGSTIGSITQNGTTAVAYNTSSDYRLKENVQPMTGALAKIAALKPVTYTWKADGSEGEGFIAHELAEVCPHAVTGEKDAVDAEGKPQYQGIDVSFLVGTLTAAIQELKAELDAVKAQLQGAA